MLTDRLAMATAAEVAYSGNDLLHLAPQQQAALLGAPAGTRFRTPVFAERCDLSEVLHGMREVQRFIHLLCC